MRHWIFLAALLAATFGFTSAGYCGGQGVGAGPAISGTSNGNSASEHSKARQMGVTRHRYHRYHPVADPAY